MKYFVALLTAFLLATTSLADVTVVGTGSVLSVTPDVAKIELTVSANSYSMSIAVKSNADEMALVLKMLREQFKIADSELRTYGYKAEPVYRPNTTFVTGYLVSNTLSVAVKDAPKAGEVIGALGTIDNKNMVRVNSVIFVISDELRNTALERARVLAIVDAKKRATTYCRAAGMAVGRVKTIAEANSTIVDVTPSLRAIAADTVDAGVLPGRSTVSTSVTVTFEIVEAPPPVPPVPPVPPQTPK